MRWREQEARQEIASRAQNEWIADANERYASGDVTDPFVCECDDPACRQPVALTTREYEQVRAVSTRFVVAVDHEDPEVDQVVRQTSRFAVVEKIFGVSMQLARETNPRTSGIPGG